MLSVMEYSDRLFACHAELDSVVAKGDLSVACKPQIKDHGVYVRSLNANNRASTSEAKRGDWERFD